MTYFIDQSGKIEQTGKDTVLCLANDHWDTVMIKGKTKRQLQEIFRRHGQNRNFVLFAFCAGVSLLLKRHPKLKSVEIDKEYFGKEAIVKKILSEMLGDRKELLSIGFSLIGRKVNAHKYAYLTFNKKLSPKCRFDSSQIIKEIKKTEVGKRLKNA